MFKQVVIQTNHGPIEGVETPYGTLALVPPLWLTVDNGSTGYQRPFDRKWAEKIAAGWHRAEARPTSCRLRDGQLWITNGQHTVNAAAIVGEERVLVIINNGSPSRQREAREFVDAQVKVKRMRPFDTYRASLVAGDTDALIVRKITNELKITIGPNKAPGVLTAIRAVRDIAERGGEDLLRETLEVSLVWPEDDLNRFQYEMLQGIAKAIDAAGFDVVQRNAKRQTATKLYVKANTDAAGRGYVTISNIAAELGRSRRRAAVPSVVHES